MGANRDYTIQSLHHALKILETFLEPGRVNQGVTQISDSLGLNKSRVFRILNTLKQHGLVQQDPDTKQYRLGLRLMTFGATASRQLSIVEVANPILDSLAEQSGETIHLGIIEDNKAVCIAKRESKHSVRLYAEVGKRVPLNAGGVPKVLLAHLPPDERSRIIRQEPLPKFTDQTITDPDELEEVLAQIRHDGYTIAINDLETVTHSIAAPIRDHSGRVVAGVSIAGPSHRFSPEKIRRFTRLVCDAAGQISNLLGYRNQNAIGV